MKVLVVDDETDVKDLFLQRFRKEIKSGQITTLFAHSVPEAMAILQDRDPMDVVLILSDINMPGQTGFDLLKETKLQFPETKVFMVSAYGDAENMDKAKRIGADDFLVKPVNFEALKQKIFQVKD
jgi:response regulator of citrate/malate metabolism